MVSLIDMPEVPMKITLEKLGYVEIQCLRKTCHSLRHFIDTTQPEQSIDALKISGSPNKISLLINGNDNINGNDGPQLYPSGQKIHVVYQALKGENARITWFRKDENRQKTILNENFSELLSRDFGLILECKLPILRTFSMDFKNTCKQFLEKYLSNKNPIKTNTLTMINAKQDDMLGFLPYICAGTLEKLVIQMADWIGPMDISKIVELEHWKKTRKIHIAGVSVAAEVRNFEHFTSLIVRFDVLYLEDVLFLKELFLHTSSTSKQYRISFGKLSDRNAFIQEFGLPLTEQRETLTFERPDDKEHVVKVEFSHFWDRVLEFKIIKKCDAPNEVEVVN
ncbi:hypothetical protein CAEBREN_14197 [Caenorhabditis brenneri]|uniref:DUF38 domain-containing protein n=1 Tax=Caenorhabditis brenneri TaxID=135651 RepID=G0N1J0_CAEBE|nr:hypothetical protein CAEBREN_14197 [Caenorhabditis brenneri]